jgi:hypothetical protein
MRKFFASGLTALALLATVPSVAYAQTSFIFGMIVGAALSSDGQSTSGDGTANVLYLMPRAAERIKDPLALRTGASDCAQFGKLTIKQTFEAKMHNAAKMEIVQVVRTSCGGSTSSVALWFVFTERENIVPPHQLPPPTQK